MSETRTTTPEAGADRLAEARRALLGRMLRGEVQAPAPRGGITRAAGGPEYPVSSQQAQLLFMHALLPESPYYNLATAHRVSAATDVALLERALAEVARRHEALRTVFRWVDGEPRQVVHPTFPVRLEIEDLRGPGGAPASEALAREKVREWSARPFDLERGPLFRCSMGRISDADCVLLFTYHHLVSDGWSLAVLIRELAELYVAFGRGEPSPLPEPRVHYPDYAVWQRAYLADGALERQLAFWREHLRGAPVEAGLPTDRPRPRVQENRGAMHRFRYADALLDRLNAVARESGATLNMVFLAAVALLLRRYGGSDDVVVGAGLGNRNREELEQMVGYLVQPGAVRVRLDGDPGFREAVRRARNAVLDAEAHQETPFHRVVDALNVPRDPARNPLFQVMYVHRSWVRAHQVDEPLRRALELRPFYQDTGDTFVETGAARFDMLWTMGEGEGGMAGSVEYDTALFDPGTVARMEAQLRAILEAGSADPDTPVSRLPLLPDADRAALAPWQGTETAAVPEPLVHRMIATQAARTPDAPAVVFRDAVLSYRELDARVNRLANRLARLGAGPETRVGICLERGAQTVVAILAVLRAGATYLPLDPAYPPERLAYMGADAGISLLVTQSSLRHLFPADMRTVAVDEDAAAIAAEPADAPRSGVCGGNAAYVIYTSGSTGRPRGVEITHANAAALFAAMDRRIGGTIPGTWLAVSRVSFDMHVPEMLWTLSRGFRVVVQPEVGDARDDESIPRQILRHGVTHLQCTPTLARELVEDDDAEALAGLDRLLVGGEALPPDLAARITALLPGRLINVYGPTETTVYSTSHAVDDDASIPIGRPLPGVRTYVLDAALRQLPAGVPGELFVGGALVGRGYLRRPALTAERYLPDPFAEAPGARMYRTGDRGHWRADGALAFGGRLDEQVKVRGFRIEPGEIEAALRDAPRVEACAVVAREDEPGQARLVAYVVGGADANVLRAHLRRTLPEHMVPSAFVALDRLPLTPSGKLDRRALPAPEPAAEEEAYVAPRTPMEETVAAIWAEVLGRERVGVRDNFFDIGGHSLLGMRVAARIHKQLQLQVTVVAIFDHPTVERLAAALATAPRAATLPLRRRPSPTAT
jgi:amino acid adenylation domain-containing protein